MTLTVSEFSVPVESDFSQREGETFAEYRASLEREPVFSLRTANNGQHKKQNVDFSQKVSVQGDF